MRRVRNLLQIILAALIALFERWARIFGLLPLSLRARERYEGADHVEHLVGRADLSRTHVPARVGPERRLDIGHADSGSLVAVRIHLRDQRGEWRPHLRRLDAHNPPRAEFGT